MRSVSRHRLATYIAQQLATGAPSKNLAQQIAAYLVDNKQTQQADLLLQDVNYVLAKDHGFVSANVTSAHPLSDDIKAIIADYVKSADNAKSVELTESVDDDLIGGVIVRTPSAVFDSSIRTQLRHLGNIKDTRSN